MKTLSPPAKTWIVWPIRCNGSLCPRRNWRRWKNCWCRGRGAMVALIALATEEPHFEDDSWSEIAYREAMPDAKPATPLPLSKSGREAILAILLEPPKDANDYDQQSLDQAAVLRDRGTRPSKNGNAVRDRPEGRCTGPGPGRSAPGPQ